MSDAFFRAGIGAMVIDDRRRILVLKRKGARDGAWQMPQGGMDRREEPVEALHRELKEETGLKARDVEVVASIEDWLVYELPPAFRNKKVGRGQAHRWFLCRLLAPRTAVRPDRVEFTAAEWVTPDELLARAVAFRLPIYRRLVTEFARYLRP